MSYNLIKTIPSCAVERKLLLELENYAQRKTTELAPPYEKVPSARSYYFIVIDKFGLETLKSVGEYQRSYFPDDTRRIAIESRSTGESSLSIEVKFSTSKTASTLEVRYDGNSAREVAAGIAAEIILIIESYKTVNHWFHYLSGLPLALILYAAVVVVLMILTNFKLAHADLITTSFLSLIFGAGAIGLISTFNEQFRPYSTFETRRNERRKKQLSWVLLGTLGFLLFTVVGVYFRQRLFGF